MTRSLFLSVLTLALTAACRTPDPASTTLVGSELDPTAETSAIPASSTLLPVTSPVAPTRAVFLGDSITVGIGADVGLSYSELMEINDAAVWPEFSAEDLESLFGPMEIENVAVAGATSANVVLQQLDTLEDRLGPPPWSGETVVFMTIGGNDMQFAIPRLSAEGDAAADEILDGMEDNLEVVFAFFEDPAHFPDGAHIYFTNVYEPTDGVGLAGTCLGGFDIGPLLGYLEDANELYLDLANDHGAGMLDLRTAFLGHGMNATDPELDVYRADDPTEWFAADCIHPNERGHHEVRRLFHGALVGEVR